MSDFWIGGVGGTGGPVIPLPKFLKKPKIDEWIRMMKACRVAASGTEIPAGTEAIVVEQIGPERFAVEFMIPDPTVAGGVSYEPGVVHTSEFCSEAEYQDALAAALANLAKPSCVLDGAGHVCCGDACWCMNDGTKRWHGLTSAEALLDGLVPKSKLAAAEEVARLARLKADGLEADLKHAIDHRERLVAAEKEQSTRLRAEVLQLRDALRSKEDEVRQWREWKAPVVTDRQSDDALSEAAERQNRVWSAHEVALAKVQHQTLQVALLVLGGGVFVASFLAAWRWL